MHINNGLDAQASYPCYSDGSFVTPGDEWEVLYPELLGIIPHRGLVYRVLPVGPDGALKVDIIHNSKAAGCVCVTTLENFSQGNEIRLRRRPSSPEHAQIILDLATSALGHPYSAPVANCEHFTDWCYSGGVDGNSPTLRGIVTISAVVALTYFGNSGRR